MADSSTDGGFFAYYRKYAHSGIHAATAAAMTGFGLFAAQVNSWFFVLAIAVYVLPPIFLYLTGEGENVPSVVGNESNGDERGDRSDVEIDRRGDDAATTRDFETGSTDEPGTESDSTIAGSESGTRTADSTDADAGATADDRSTDESEASRSEPDESASEAVFAPSPESTAEHDASSQRDGEEPSSAGREPTADDTAATDEPESAVEEISDDEPNTEPGWTEADTRTDESLLDVVSTRNGAYAVGESGVVLARDDDGWSVALEEGPTTNSNPLRGVDTTADGETVWFAGDSGVLGRYEDGRLTDHSAPKDQTSTWEDVAVTGKTGAERIHLVNGSGELLRGDFEDGSVSWGDIEQPGSGSSISAIAFVDSDRGHICDTNQCVYETTDGGESYEKIGIEDANAAFTGIAATDSTVVVAGDDGSVFRYDGAVWTRLHASDSALSAIDLAGETGLAAGDGGGIYELAEGSWGAVETPTDADLHGIVIGSGEQASPDVAIGADGTAIERHR